MAKRFNEKDFSEEKLDEYSGKFSESGLWSKVSGNAKKIGQELIYDGFKLYYVAQNPNCPMKIKAGIFGALGYLITPFDLVLDVVPIVGYTDDAAAIAAAVALAHVYIDDEVKFQAKNKMADLLGEEFTRDLD